MLMGERQMLVMSKTLQKEKRFGGLHNFLSKYTFLIQDHGHPQSHDVCMHENIRQTLSFELQKSKQLE